jgi:hypothetical protein
LSRLKITPSSFQVNEGEGITTSIDADFAPGTTLFYKVVGRGVSKKDFAAGRVKGSLKVDADGFASIAHTLRADKKTEGAESFRIQIFSDKKMRNRIGQSDAVGIADTSMKAKGSGGGGGRGARRAVKPSPWPAGARRAVDDAIDGLSSARLSDTAAVQREVVQTLARFWRRETGRRPVVLPIVQEL